MTLMSRQRRHKRAAINRFLDVEAEVNEEEDEEEDEEEYGRGSFKFSCSLRYKSF